MSGAVGGDAYVVETEGAVAVVDPGIEPGPVERFLEEGDVSLEFIALTHVHFDHSAAAASLRRSTGAEVCVHRAEADELELGGPLTLSSAFSAEAAACTVDRRLDEGDRVCGMEVLHTPGHSPGSCCLVTGSGAFVGDLVFPGGSFGRTDLQGGSPGDLVKSLERMAPLDLEEFYSGHGGRGRWSDVGAAARLAGATL
ncbi:MAG: Hydroxyacylglutathione hydrolase [Methanonatronarchaeales archaeon]|nr:Hydroxyacylglutathione hydrolase [Methanonatronarchaeales archaeon]